MVQAERAEIGDVEPVPPAKFPREQRVLVRHQQRAVGHPRGVRLGCAGHRPRELGNLTHAKIERTDPENRRLSSGGRFALDEADRIRARNVLQRSADVSRDDLRLAARAIRDLQGRRLSEHEERDRLRVEPGVIADRLDVGQQHLGILAAQRELPQALRLIGFNTDDRNVLPIRCDRRRILALRRIGYARRLARGDLIPIDVGLLSTAVRGE
jgi:hypothetical protein